MAILVNADGRALSSSLRKPLGLAAQGVEEQINVGGIAHELIAIALSPTILYENLGCQECFYPCVLAANLLVYGNVNPNDLSLNYERALVRLSALIPSLGKGDQ